MHEIVISHEKSKCVRKCWKRNQTVTQRVTKKRSKGKGEDSNEKSSSSFLVPRGMIKLKKFRKGKFDSFIVGLNFIYFSP